MLRMTILVSLAALSGCGATDNAETPRLGEAIGAEAQAAMLAQAPLKAAAHGILAVVQDAPGFNSISLGANRVVLSWHGALNDEAQAAISNARKTVNVDVRSAPYSLAELRAARARLIDYVSTNAISVLHSIDISGDGTRLVAYVDPGTRGDVSLPSLDVPVDIEERERPEQTSRHDDARNGGAVMKTPLGTCTTGVPVLHLSNGRPDWVGVLSAGHCAEVGQPIADGLGRPVGHVRAKNALHDLLVVDTGISVGSAIYRGENDRHVVTTLKTPWLGEMVCFAGATSGDHCGSGYRITSLDYSYRDQFGAWHLDMGFALNTNSDNRGGPVPGDSGGPVYNIPFPYFGDLEADGIVSGSSKKIDLIFSPITNAQRDFGIGKAN